MKSTKKTVEERRKELEYEMFRLDAIDDVAEWIDEEIDKHKSNIKNYSTRTNEIGREDEQAMNAEGELLWVTDRYNYWAHTEEWLNKKAEPDDLETKVPYYRPITEVVTITEDDMDEWTKKRVLVEKMIIELLENAKRDL